MSGVVKRKRNLSHMEFYKKSIEIREILTRYVMNEKNVPKRYRFIFSIPIIDSLHRLTFAIINANSIYPLNEEELLLRKEYQRQALVEVSYLLQTLDFIITVIPQNKSRVARIVTLLYEEYNLIKGWKKSSKIIKATEKDIETEEKDENNINIILETINVHLEGIKEEEIDDKQLDLNE